MAKKLWYPTTEKFLVVAAAATTDVIFGPVKSNRVYHIQNVTVEDETSAPTDVRIIIDNKAGECPLKEFNSPGSGVLSSYGGDFCLMEGDRLLGRWTGATVADRLTMCVFGFFTDDPEFSALYHQ